MPVRRYRLSAVCQPATAARLTLLETFQIVREFGGEGQNRTVDTTIFSRMLYQLSYLAPGVRSRELVNSRFGKLVNSWPNSFTNLPI
jgi:hypothetical protein